MVLGSKGMVYIIVPIKQQSKDISSVSCQNYLELCHVKIILSVDRHSISLAVEDASASGELLESKTVPEDAGWSLLGECMKVYWGDTSKKPQQYMNFQPFHLKQNLKNRPQSFWRHCWHGPNFWSHFSVFSYSKGLLRKGLLAHTKDIYISCFLVEGYNARPWPFLYEKTNPRWWNFRGLILLATSPKLRLEGLDTLDGYGRG